MLLPLPWLAVAADALVGRVIANGGTSRASDGALELGGTIGEPVAGRSAAGTLQLDSGFWAPATTPRGAPIFNDGFEGD